MQHLTGAAKEIKMLPGLSVSKFSDQGYITVSHPMKGGVMVHGPGAVMISVKKEMILQGWRDKNGLWSVLLMDNVANTNTDTIPMTGSDKKQSVHNVYYLPLIEAILWYLHAACGFPTKATWLAAIQHGNFIG